MPHIDASKVLRFVDDSDPGSVRRERVVHELDGIRGEVPPDRVLDLGTMLWDAIKSNLKLSGDELLIGLDAGGIIPTIALSIASGLSYQLAWKLDLDIREKIRFSEPHARRTDIFLYGKLTGRRVILVDDEVTTGTTLANLIVELQRNCIDVVGAVTIASESDSAADDRITNLNVKLLYLTKVNNKRE